MGKPVTYSRVNITTNLQVKSYVIATERNAGLWVARPDVVFFFFSFLHCAESGHDDDDDDDYMNVSHGLVIGLRLPILKSLRVVAG